MLSNNQLRQYEELCKSVCLNHLLPHILSNNIPETKPKEWGLRTTTEEYIILFTKHKGDLSKMVDEQVNYKIKLYATEKQTQENVDILREKIINNTGNFISSKIFKGLTIEELPLDFIEIYILFVISDCNFILAYQNSGMEYKKNTFEKILRMTDHLLANHYKIELKYKKKY